MYDYDLICIGSGPAGEKAATQAAYYHKKTAIIERCSRPGGAMVNTGTVPSKALRETALLCSAFRRRPLPGMDFAVDHHVSVPKFMARRHLIEQQEHDRIETSIDRHGIDIHHGSGRVLDGKTIVVEGENGERTTLTAKHILIATGSSPVRPAHIPFDHPAIVDADGVLELDRMPSSMIIVGAGVIGCEYASVFAEIGVNVTIINPREEILAFLDPECRDLLVKGMRSRGIEMCLGTTVEKVDGNANGRAQVVCGDGTCLEADVLLWAAGRQANTGGLGLENAGIELGTRGLVVVNEHYQTNVPSVYAAGDVIGFPALAATSMEQGRIAACAMFGIEFKTELAGTIPMGIYTIPGISSVGVTESEARAKGLEVVTGTAPYRNNVRGRMLGDEQGLVKCVFDRHDRRLLGASIIGEDATELIHIAQFAIVANQGIDDFINACFNYPTLSEMYKYAAYDALQHIAQEDAANRLGTKAA